MLRLLVPVMLFALSAAAQPHDLFDPDDFVDPRQHDGPVFFSRLVLGGASNLSDHFRPLDQNAGFLHLSNHFYWTEFQFNYKHSEVRSEDHGPVRVQQCGQCDPPVFFPTPPPPGAVPAPPPTGSKDTLQIAWYRQAGGGSGRIPVMLRYLLTASLQKIDSVITDPFTGQVLSRRSGDEHSIGIEGDIWIPMAGRDVFGSFQYARTVRRGTVDDLRQQELTVMSRLPGMALGRVLFRPSLIIGGVSGRAGTAINVVNPQFEAFLHERTTRANFHLVWSPQFLNSGLEGWTTTHQIAIFVDRALFVKLFGKE